ncbi:sarcosine oxidase subunit gamma [Solirhodobacter olei]|uniref:sarcosine oxidase subunit gamma n=1 Tax=Solirhodobacter olei TaxID=2493082 RepID=UPI001F4EC103|nr:sarcosine oxidase subunit gamma [Solirhodobacter olei]
MAELLATSPLEGLVPLSAGPFTLSDAGVARITSVAPFAGKEKAVSAALKKAHGLAFPAPNTVISKGEARIVWTGRGQAFLIGADPAPLAGIAALTDQSDGWAVLRLDGPEAERVLARKVAVDLRPAVFGEGAVVRTALGHMMSVILRAGAGFEIFVFRSMAHTAVHEIGEAMRAVAARG